MIRISSTRLNLENGRLDRAQMKAYTETINALGSVSGAVTIDLSLGNIVTATTTGASTFTVTNPPSSSGMIKSFTLILINGGYFTHTWMSGTRWVGGVAPTLSTTAKDVLTFFTPDAGVSWIGSFAGEFLGGKLYAMGENGLGQLGQNDVVHRSSPTQVGTFATWAQVAAASATSFGIKTDGTLWSWGSISNGLLGINEAAVDRSSPVQVGTLANWLKISANNSFAVAIKTDGTMWSWGNNSSGFLGQNDTVTRSSPTQIGVFSTWSKVVAGTNHLYALKTDGTLWAWGQNFYGQLAQNNTTTRSSPAQIGLLTNWADIGTVGNSALALKIDGTLWVWGRNFNGQLGLGDVVDRSSPVQVGTLATWARVVDAGGSNSSFAITTGGTLFAWGLNTSGQLGQNDVVNRSSPTQVGTLATWARVTSGFVHASALKTDGTMWAWGFNGYGVLGLGDTVSRSSPVQVGTLAAWVQFVRRGSHSLAILLS